MGLTYEMTWGRFIKYIHRPWEQGDSTTQVGGPPRPTTAATTPNLKLAESRDQDGARAHRQGTYDLERGAIE